MLADIVGSLRKGDANHHKFFRYRDDVVGRRLGIVCISDADRIDVSISGVSLLVYAIGPR